MNSFRIGLMRSGRVFEIPYELLDLDVASYLSQFSDSELVDILCLSEQYALTEEQQSKDGAQFRSMKRLGDALFRKRQEPLFLNLLDELGLHNSAAFIRHAKTLLK